MRDAILGRLKDLIEQGSYLRATDDKGHATSSSQVEDCRAWLTASRHIVQLLAPGGSAYLSHIIEVNEIDYEMRVPQAVGEISAVLRNVLADLEMGLLSSIESIAKAEVFDDFLDHARAYLEEGLKDQAGVISGVVFEDTIRRIAKNNGIEDSDKPLDSIISWLRSEGLISGVVAKRGRAAAGVRTHATHAQWEGFGIEDVRATIALTDELILKNLSG